MKILNCCRCNKPLDDYFYHEENVTYVTCIGCDIDDMYSIPDEPVMTQEEFQLYLKNRGHK